MFVHSRTTLTQCSRVWEHLEHQTHIQHFEDAYRTGSHILMSQCAPKAHSRIETLIFWLSWNLQRICFPTQKTSDHPSLWTYFKCNDYYLWMWISVWLCSTWKKFKWKTISNEFFHDFTEYNTCSASATSHRLYKLNVKNACSNNSSIIYIQIQRNKTE